MNDRLIKKNYLKKTKLLNKYNKFYYDKNNPAVNDQEYDQLKKDVLEIEKKYPSLISKESPSLKVGFKPSKIFNKNYESPREKIKKKKRNFIIRKFKSIFN